MADRAIAATDVTAQVIFAYDTPDYAGQKSQRVVGVEISITADAANPAVLWPAADLPLTNLFTAGNANDTLLDVTRPIRSTPGLFTLDPAGVAPASTDRAYMARFTSIASTAAGKLLCIYRPAVASTALLRAADNEDVSGANFLGADTTYRCFIILTGTRRTGSNT